MTGTVSEEASGEGRSLPETSSEDDLAEVGDLTGDEPWLQWTPPPVLCRCQRCPHEWHRRTLARLPLQCPNCKSPRWNEPRKNRRLKTT
jgi:hypothetical protein